MGHFKSKFQVKGDIAHQPLLVTENQSDYPFMWYQNIGSMFFRFVTKHACDGRTDGLTDGWTERQNYDPHDRASIAALHSKNEKQFIKLALLKCKKLNDIYYCIIHWTSYIVLIKKSNRVTK